MEREEGVRMGADPGCADDFSNWPITLEVDKRHPNQEAIDKIMARGSKKPNRSVEVPVAKRTAVEEMSDLLNISPERETFKPRKKTEKETFWINKQIESAWDDIKLNYRVIGSQIFLEVNKKKITVTFSFDLLKFHSFKFSKGNSTFYFNSEGLVEEIYLTNSSTLEFFQEHFEKIYYKTLNALNTQEEKPTATDHTEFA